MLDYKKLDYKSLEKLFYSFSLTHYFKFMNYDYHMPIDDHLYNDIVFLLRYDVYFKSLYNKYCSYRINKNKKIHRVRYTISQLLLKDCVFLTLTFRNDILSQYSNKKLRELVSRFLNTFNVPYIANIDFGSSNGRVHFHAIVQIPEINFKLWKFGSINGIKIRSCSIPDKIANYITKLSFHSFKDTTKDMRVIYSRSKPYNNIT